MKTDALISDPIFQLNLLLWMAKEQPGNDYRVRPLFYDLKFEIIYIEQPFAFPEGTLQAITDSGLDISFSPEPELILGRKSDHKALYFEAKANSFGPDSSNCKQARAHLVASGPTFSEVLAPLKSCLLCYVVPQEACISMAACLSTLSKELKGKRLKPAPFSSHGLSFDGKQIIYSWDDAFKTHVGFIESQTPVLHDVSEDTDPSPLILVYSDEDCPNDDIRHFYRRALIDQARACLLCDLHANSVGVTYETTPDQLLAKTTDGIFQYLGRTRQKSLRRLFRENIFKKISASWKEKQPGIKLVGDQLTITWSVAGEKEDFLDWLEDRRVHFEVGKPEEDIPLLLKKMGVDE